MRPVMLALCLVAAFASGCTLYGRTRGTAVPGDLEDVGPYQLGTGQDLMSRAIDKGMKTLEVAAPALKGKTCYIEIAEVAALRNEELRNYIVSLVEAKLTAAGIAVVPVTYSQTYTEKEALRLVEVKAEPPKTDLKAIVHVHNSGVDHYYDAEQLMFLFRKVKESLTGTFWCSVSIGGMRFDSQPASEEYIVQNATKIFGMSIDWFGTAASPSDFYLVTLDSAEHRNW